MNLYINNLPAALPPDFSFDYIMENRLFSNADGFTLPITLPLRGCSANQAIFGAVHRRAVASGEVVFDSEIRARGFHKYGAAVVTEITEAEVKVQFLDGRSRQNYTTPFDKIYINELDLGRWPEYDDPAAPMPLTAWNPTAMGHREVALPWRTNVNADEAKWYNVAEVNRAEYPEAHEPIEGIGGYVWSGNGRHSWQPFLLYLTTQILAALGYTADLGKWQGSRARHILMCNTLPVVLNKPSYADALPRWTVDEYFDQLELLLGGEFDFDHKAKTVTFDFTKDRLSAVRAVNLTKVVDEYSTTVQQEDPKCDYIGTKNIAYKHDDSDWWKLRDCEWITRAGLELVEYPTLAELIEVNKAQRQWGGLSGQAPDRLLYAADVDGYFIIDPGTPTSQGMYYSCRLVQVNGLGKLVNGNSADDSGIELGFVPATIADGMLILSPAESAADSTEDQPPTEPLRCIKAGKPKEKTQYYDKIHVAYYDGRIRYIPVLAQPAVAVDSWEIADDWSGYTATGAKFRLNDRTEPYAAAATRIDPTRKTTLTFIADSMPDARAMYYINGKRYLCEKLTATLNEHGMSRLIKGEFWPVAD